MLCRLDLQLSYSSGGVLFRSLLEARTACTVEFAVIPWGTTDTTVL